MALALTKRLPGDYLIITLIISVTIFIKFAIPFAGTQIFFAFFIVSLATAYGFFARVLEINVLRLSLFLILMGILFLTQCFSLDHFSILSLIMVALVLVPYVFQLKKNQATPGFELTFFRKLSIIFAVLGIAQFLLQFIIGSYWAFFIDYVTPDAFYMQDYFGLRPMNYGSNTFKPTAFFLLEPAHLSQILSIAIIFELIFFKNIKVLALLFLSLAMTFSGTGLVSLFMVLPFLLVYQKKFFILFCSFIFVLSAPLWASYVGLDKTVDRADEVLTKGSSGYARFVGPYEVIRDYQVADSLQAVVFGKGAGQHAEYRHNEYEIANSTWAKIFFEYGLLGAIGYIGFLMCSVLMSRRNAFVVATMMVSFWLLGENIFPPTYHALMLAFFVWPVEKYDENSFLEPKKQMPDEI